MKKIKKMVVLLLPVMLCLSGCQKTQETEKTKTEVGIALYNEKDAFLGSIIKNVFTVVRDPEEAFDNLELEMQDAAADQLLQNSQIRRFIDIKCDVLCANLVDRTSAGSIVSAAKDADIPVIFFERQPVEQDIEWYEKAYYLGSDAKECDKLDTLYKEETSKLTKKELVVAHEAFGYLCHAYGLEQMGIEGLSADDEPDPKQMSEVIRFAKEHQVKTIFFEELVSPKVAKTIAKETGANAKMLNPLEGLSNKKIKAGEDYFSVMKQNLAAIKEALSE